MGFDVGQTHKIIIEKLSKNERPRINICKDDLLALLQELKNHFPPQNTEQAKEVIKILCIIQHTQSYFPEINSPLIELLSLENKYIQSSDIIIFTLACLQKHCIDHYKMQGQKIPSEILFSLVNLLKNSKSEVRTWVARLLDEIGNQAIIYKDLVKKARPHFLTMNKDDKETRRIINQILAKWNKR